MSAFFPARNPDTREPLEQSSESSQGQSLKDGVEARAGAELPQHSIAPYCGGGGDGVVLDDLLLGAHGAGTSCRTAFWTWGKGDLSIVY